MFSQYRTVVRNIIDACQNFNETTGIKSFEIEIDKRPFSFRNWIAAPKDKLDKVNGLPF